MRATRCWVAVALVPFVLVTAAACGAQPPGGPAPTSISVTPVPSVTVPSVSVPSVSVPMPSVTAPSIARPTGPKPAPGAGEIVVEGTVTEGVEAKCLLLATGSENYLLLGADPQIATPGKRITVRGKVEPGMATFCMQGTPFAVVEAKPAQ